ncbi:MAG: NADH-quinone oxidoreductase subunit C [Candidatus Neomarinimicrobiota bacterium]
MSVPRIISRIKEGHSDAILDVTQFAGDTTLHVKGDAILQVLKELKGEGFNFLADLTAVDNLTLGGFERFVVVYHLLSHEKVERLTVKAHVPEDDPSLASVESLWRTADWQEREVYDLYGIRFEGHPDLTRILNPHDYEGYPLRKDYPRVGRGERKDFPVVERKIGSKSPRK